MGSCSAIIDKDAETKPIERTEICTLKKVLLSPFKMVQFDVLKDINFILWCLADIVVELS